MDKPDNDNGTFVIRWMAKDGSIVQELTYTKAEFTKELERYEQQRQRGR